MWKKKNIISILLSFIAITLVLVGCSPKDTSNDKVQVSFWHVYSEDFGAPVIKDMVKEFNESQDEIEVEEVYNPNMYPGLMQNLQAEAAAGKTPSIAMIGYNYLDYFANNFDYTSPTEIEEGTYLSDTYLDNILSLAQIEGEQIGIPFSISTPILYYNADLFEEAGLDPDRPPQTWEEVRQYAKQITDETDSYGFYMQEYADNWAIQGLLEGNGARILSDDKEAIFASDESIEAYELLADMVLEDKSALHITADEGFQIFSSGNIGMVVGSSAKIGTIEDASNFDLRGAKFPVFEGKERRVPAGGNFLPIMGETEEEKQAAWKFIKFIMEPKWLAEWTKGTGYLPPREDVAQDPDGLKLYIEEHELLGIAFEEMADIHSWVAFPDDIGTVAEQLFADTRDRILGGDASPEEALQDAENELNKLLGK